jgi:hypothetical protein
MDAALIDVARGARSVAAHQATANASATSAGSGRRGSRKVAMMARCIWSLPAWPLPVMNFLIRVAGMLSNSMP